MCDNTVSKRTDPFDEPGTFLVIRDATAQNLHVKGQYNDLENAVARRDEMVNAGHEAVIVFVPAAPVGDTGHSQGRAIVQAELEPEVTGHPVINL